MDLQKIEGILFAFDADIYGNHLFKMVCSKEDKSKFDDIIEFRIDFDLWPILINLLKLDYDVFMYPISEKGSKRRIITISSETGNITLHALLLNKHAWRESTCDFDVNLLAINKYSMYIRTYYKDIERIPNKIQYLIEKIQNQRFSLLNHPHDTILTRYSSQSINDIIATNITNATNMVKNGWTMNINDKSKFKVHIFKWEDEDIHEKTK